MRRLTLLAVAVFVTAYVATRASTTDIRIALAVAIGGVQVPAEIQPRVIIEMQRGAPDRARVRVAGPLAFDYVRSIAPGDPIRIVAATVGSSMTMFEGTVSSLEPTVVGEPFVVIHATSLLPPTAPSRTIATIAHGVPADARLVDFAPRLSARSSLQRVVITGVLDATGAAISGVAAAPAIALADTEWSGATITVETARRFASQDDADAFARITLAELLTARVSAEVLTDGIADLTPDSLVEVTGAGTGFDGQYYVTAVKHQFGGDSYGGYSTALGLRRADLGMFHHPEIDDEVLVSFASGDTLRPYVVGSLWDCEPAARGETSDDDRRCRLIRWPW